MFRQSLIKNINSIKIASAFEYLLKEMSSLSNIEEHMEEQPMKKRRVDNSEEMLEKAKPTEVNLQKTMEADKNKGLGTSTTMADLPPSADRHRKLPAELNSQIFYCLNLPTRRKFICGLGWNFYAMFRQILLTKSKRLCNPAEGNGWSRSTGNVTISEDGLFASNTTGWKRIFAEKGFPISVADCRMDDFPGTICYYYEVKTLSERFSAGFSHGGFVSGVSNRNSYTIATLSTNGHYGEYEYTQVPMRARPELNFPGNVFGCGLLMDPDNKVTIFFTLNGILLGKQNPISPSVDRLYPVVSIWENVATFEANFGNNKDKPFEYDIIKCPGMGLDCI